MLIVKRMVCLANSIKLSGHCVAGREIAASGAPGHWIRPVSSRPEREVSEKERQLEDTSEPELLDILEIALKKHVPQACHSEDWLLDANRRWRRVGRIHIEDVEPYVEAPLTLWINGHSTRHGINDEIPQQDADKLPNSLHLIRAEDVTIRVSEQTYQGVQRRPQVRAHFEYGADHYRLSATDPLVRDRYLAQGNGVYSLGPCYLTVSLGEPFQKQGDGFFRYKLVAGVMPIGGGLE